MPAPTPRNPKGAGRKPTPDHNKKMQSFWCDADISQELENWQQYGFATKAAMINFALRNLIQVYKALNGEK